MSTSRGVLPTERPGRQESGKRTGMASGSSMCNQGTITCLVVAFFIGLLLMTILVPLSLSSIEYYEYGLVQQRSTGSMKLNRGVFNPGRYHLGPDRTFKKFKADAHLVEFDELSVFSESKLETELDISVIYFLREDKLVDLHEQFEKNYREVVSARMVGAIKNTAPQFSTATYFENRLKVERELLKAVRNATESAFIEVTSLFLGRVGIPEKIRARQLGVAVQLEANEEEEFLQQSRLIRQNTTRFVSARQNKATIVTEKANAAAKLLTEKARADAAFLVEESRFKGLSIIFDALNITTPQEKNTLDFLKAIEANDKAGLYFDFNSLSVKK